MCTMPRRCTVIVLDSLGVGALPDAHRYGDSSANTLRHIRERTRVRLPNLAALGLWQAAGLPQVEDARASLDAAWGRLAEVSAGKDTTTGHWELAGIVTRDPFPVYPRGFPPEVMEPFSKAIGRGVLGNKPASGTEIIGELGPEHMRTGKPIVYTSADSVFQVAAHVAVVPIETLYEWCRIAREILKGPHAVARVIARPFKGHPGSFIRTEGRRDFSLPPPEATLLDYVQQAGLQVVAIGKISDIFAGRGITQALPAKGNQAVVDQVLTTLERDGAGLLFANCVDFDQLYGHRRDPEGYAQALQEFDSRLPEIRGRMGPGDLLIITADHGCDPLHSGTDHTREYVPALLLGGDRGSLYVRPGSTFGVRPTFADIAATVAEYLGVSYKASGSSFWPEIAE